VVVSCSAKKYVTVFENHIENKSEYERSGKIQQASKIRTSNKR